jgi:hypothetical protein
LIYNVLVGFLFYFLRVEMDTVLWMISKVFWQLASPDISLLLVLSAGVCYILIGKSLEED